MSNYAVEIENLTRKFSGFTLDNVSFKLEKGSVMGLIGQNGAGKTTIIRLIMNIIEKNEGSIKVFDLDNIDEEIAVKNKIGYVADEDYLYFGSTLNKYGKIYKDMFDSWDEDLFRHYIALWELPADKKFSTYSKGMKTKAMLCLALCHKPQVLIMDEPTAGLDPVARIEVLDLLREFVADGEHSVLFSTHITSDLDKIADYVTVIINGKITESMSAVDIDEKYVVISGDNSKIAGNEQYLIGTRKGSMTFEALILRENLSRFKDISCHTPNIENLLTFSIWQNRKGADNAQ